MTAALFELENVSFTVPGRSLLQPLTMSIPAACMTALIGHNGSGKSTLLKILARQHAASSGVVRFAGKPLVEWGDREIARKIAYLPQQTAPASGMLVKELVALGRYPWHGALGRFSAVDRQKVDEAIELTGIAPFVERMVDTLSGGERQRVWLAMLVAQDAECLLLDEPTSALDIAHQIEVLSLVKKLSTEKSLSIFVVLHDVNMAARFCDAVFALHSGRLIAQSTATEIMVPERLKEIYGIPMDVMQHTATGHFIAAPL